MSTNTHVDVHTHTTHTYKNKNWVQTHPDLKSVSVFAQVVVSLHSPDLGGVDPSFEP